MLLTKGPLQHKILSQGSVLFDHYVGLYLDFLAYKLATDTFFTLWYTM